MKIKKRKTIKVTLVLSEEEAVWLKSVMQNRIIQQKDTIESIKDEKMRKLFWNELNNEGITSC